MIHPRKPVWTEGLFMTPQHLQQSDLYHEALLHNRMSAVLNNAWGVTSVTFDERALSAGQVKVVKCHGYFPDGTPFLIGDRGEDQIEARPLEGAFPAAIEALDVFLAIPHVRETHANISLDPAKAGPAQRFVAQATTMADLNSGRNEQSIIWARSNMRLLFGTEPRDAFQTVRVAQLVRDRTGAVVRRKSFIPAILRASASDHLMDGVRSILSALVGKQKSLADGRRLRSDAAVDFQASDTTKFWLLHTCNTFIPTFSHLADHGSLSAEHCYMILGSLIGELCTFSPDGDPTAIPKFNYLELGDVFEPMIKRALEMIAGFVPDSFKVIPLEKREDGMYLGKFEDPQVPRTHELFLEAKGADEATLRERLPRLLKIGSWTQIGYILNSATPGLRVAVEYRPPSAIPVKPGLIYLRVDQSGDYWNDILGSGTIALYQPIDPQKVELRLIAVQTKK
jgi:type VI secretion system protein ImpJ